MNWWCGSLKLHLKKIEVNSFIKGSSQALKIIFCHFIYGFILKVSSRINVYQDIIDIPLKWNLKINKNFFILSYCIFHINDLKTNSLYLLVAIPPHVTHFSFSSSNCKCERFVTTLSYFNLS